MLPIILWVPVLIAAMLLCPYILFLLFPVAGVPKELQLPFVYVTVEGITIVWYRARTNAIINANSLPTLAVDAEEAPAL